MTLRAVAFHSTIALSTISQQLMDYDLLSFNGPVEARCPSCGRAFVAFFAIEQGIRTPSYLLELQEKLLEQCNRGMHSFKRVELMSD